jgi:Resistance to inhibitors of cholinesterase homologue 3
MRAAAFQAQQQHQQKGQGSNSIVMPIYTFGIVAFFVFTIVKMVMKKANKSPPQIIDSDPAFVEKVFKKAEADSKKNLGEQIARFQLLLSRVTLGDIKLLSFSYLPIKTAILTN